MALSGNRKRSLHQEGGGVCVFQTHSLFAFITKIMAVIKMSQMSLGIHQQHSLDFEVERAEKDCKITPHMIEYTKENFIKAAVEFCTDESGIVSISNKYHIAPGTIKKAAAVLLSKEYEQRMS